jgi:hypothetical protein
MSRVFIVRFPSCLMIDALMNCRVKVRRKRLALLGTCLVGLYPLSNEDLLILRKYFFCSVASIIISQPLRNSHIASSS